MNKCSLTSSFVLAHLSRVTQSVTIGALATSGLTLPWTTNPPRPARPSRPRPLALIFLYQVVLSKQISSPENVFKSPEKQKVLYFVGDSAKICKTQQKLSKPEEAGASSALTDAVQLKRRLPTLAYKVSCFCALQLSFAESPLHGKQNIDPRGSAPAGQLQMIEFTM